MLSYVRKDGKPEHMLLVVANFADVKQNFRVGVPYEGKYTEILNTDAKIYGGSGDIDNNTCNTTETEWDGKPYAIDMVSAPLSISIFSYTPYTTEEKAEIERVRAEKIRKAKEEEERRVAQEAAEAIAREAAEAKKLAKAAAAEAKERAKEADEMVRRAKEAADKLKKITEAQEARAKAQKETVKTVGKEAPKAATKEGSKPVGKPAEKNERKQTASSRQDKKPQQ